MFIYLYYVYLVIFFWKTMSGAPAAAGCQRRGCHQRRDGRDGAGWPRSAGLPRGLLRSPPTPLSAPNRLTFWFPLQRQHWVKWRAGGGSPRREAGCWRTGFFGHNEPRLLKWAPVVGGPRGVFRGRALTLSRVTRNRPQARPEAGGLRQTLPGKSLIRAAEG